ncbi:uncharacterized protein K02A2.6-like [Ischnura elegans]|uniref:uncharacterized protein K02A2.6-like n=1 Tax=Ischnura elegans TaxID=197161 RepID=UPI001ED8970B|nr:uncharacterized protein K02A2.6-like [Ischnura elegans]
MKMLASQYFWWPGLDEDIERYVRSCHPCLSNSRSPGKSVLIKFHDAKHVFDRIHLDFLGPYKGKMFLIMIDAFSKWPEVFEMTKTDSQSVIEKLRDCFACFGLPNIIITDNGRQFTSLEFKNFCANNGIVHRLSAPYHPSTKGAAENCVKTFKEALNRLLGDMRQAGLSMCSLVSKYLFSYRTTPHCATNETPAKLMFGREPKTRLSFLSASFVAKYNRKQIEYHHGQSNINFNVGEVVYVKDYRVLNKTTWVKATIVKVLGFQTYLCEVADEGKVLWKRHSDQIIKVGEFHNDCETKDGCETDILCRPHRLSKPPDKLNF